METEKYPPLYISYEDWIPDPDWTPPEGEEDIEWQSPDRLPTTVNLYFDIVTSITHISEVEISEFPTARHEFISDHIIQKNKVITFTATVSDHPHDKNNAISTPYGGANGMDEIRYQPGALQEVELQYPQPYPTKELIPEIKYPEQDRTKGEKVRNYISNANPQTLINAAVPNIGETYWKHPYKVQPTRSGDQRYFHYPRTTKPDVKLLGWFPAPHASNSNFNTRQYKNMEDKRSVLTYWMLRYLQSNNFPCQICTDEEFYFNMYIKSIEVVKTPESGESITFNITAQEIKRVYKPSIAETSSNDPVVKNKKKAGTKTPTPLTPQEAEAMNRETQGFNMEESTNDVPRRRTIEEAEEAAQQSLEQ